MTPRGANGTSRRRRGRARDAPDARRKTQTLRPETLQHGARDGGGVNPPRVGTREARTRATETETRRD
eukprot:CAMPEP_0203009932 /NCGR_PEP_ID=MMETSP1401-20130829/10000_1 /ASSEMBLY_ACC=CAM_ASM_000894 /TAXON_ID=38833 /ORGANISM="Micromonas pusilla, Strain CCAC1681" /LENGTH=67 /DNA_ID=CAMNT_0049751605 /DNA_START=71 /DNA_END=271 /DNA_ORIENTATION=+